MASARSMRRRNQPASKGLYQAGQARSCAPAIISTGDGTISIAPNITFCITTTRAVGKNSTLALYQLTVARPLDKGTIGVWALATLQ